jgi:hypothetical protein
MVPPEKLQKAGGEGPIYRPIQYPQEIQAALMQVNNTIATPLQKSQTVSLRVMRFYLFVFVIIYRYFLCEYSLQNCKFDF